MPKITVKSIEELSTGKKLKQLIQGGITEGLFTSQKDFIRKYNQWLSEQHPQEVQIAEKDLSRWINDKVTPRENKLVLFAEFFDVDVGYLQCKQTRKRKRSPRQFTNYELLDDSDLIEQLNRERKIDRFKEYCETLGLQFQIESTDSEAVTYETEVISNNRLYNLEITDVEGVAPETVVTLPTGEVLHPTGEQLQELVENVDNMIMFEFSKLK